LEAVEMSEDANIAVPPSLRLERRTVVLVAAAHFGLSAGYLALGRALGPVFWRCEEYLAVFRDLYRDQTPPDVPFLCTEPVGLAARALGALVFATSLPAIALSAIVGTERLEAIPGNGPAFVLFNGVVLGVIVAGVQETLRRRSLDAVGHAGSEADDPGTGVSHP
jgi:hypothetical protein